MLYLASQSPRRRELLQQLGIAYAPLDVEVPEVRALDEAPQEYVSRVARDKARAGFARVADAVDALVIGSDTEVVLDGEVFGKPADAAQAGAMLRRLSGRTHAVISAVWGVDAQQARCELCISSVRFARLDDAT
ncbi:Maf family protein, partial [Frateuria sp.]